MQALVLAGGEGTRLRPLTLTVPKPVMPLAGRPFLSFMLDWLAGHGVEEAILSCGFMGADVERMLGDEHGDVRLRYVTEEEPLGTAGPVRLAADLGMLEERLLVLNGDVLTDIDLSALLARHHDAEALATITLVGVEDPSSYGVVPTTPDGRVGAFLEKQPGPPPTDRINAGAYVLERTAVEGIAPGRAVSFEREVFPALAERGELYAYQAQGYWNDIGTPERYLEATRDLLMGTLSSSLPERTASGSLLHETARVDGAEVGGHSVVGARCELAPGARLSGAVLFDGVRVGDQASVVGSVLAERVVVEAGARIDAGAMVGADACVVEGASVPAGARVAPGERVSP